VVELGPGSGELGGRLVYSGTTKDLLTHGTTLSAEYLRGIKSIHIPHWRRKGNGEFLTITGASGNNLKSVDLSIPLGTLSCITGVSGSGKSTLIMDTLYNALAHRFGIKAGRALDYDSIEGVRYIRDVRLIDQGPIGKTPRSNPITYIGGFDEIRSFYASLKEATAMGMTAGSFSFNVPGGRCEECAGEGAKKLEMYFLPDVYTKCPACNGKRYRPQVLEVRCMGKNIHNILNMTFNEAYSFFSPLPALARRISILKEVGLGYLKLGQAATTLSGGEAQRLKIARELTPEQSKGRSANLSKLKGGKLRAKDTGREPGQRLYILDEPTTGLHTDDIKKLLSVLNRLVDSGNTIIIVEHNLELIKTADFIADIGPEGGIRGGEIIATGTPEDIASVTASHTGRYLKKLL
jgi:excinuclease ABC subunit A